jgi:hypothetical protein
VLAKMNTNAKQSGATCSEPADASRWARVPEFDRVLVKDNGSRVLSEPQCMPCVAKASPASDSATAAAAAVDV